MDRKYLAIPAIILSGNLLAQPPIILDPPFPEEKGMVVMKEEVENIYGKCGNAKVNIYGVTKRTDSFFKIESPTGKIEVLTGKTNQDNTPITFVYTPGKELVDYTMLNCVKTSTGNKLVVVVLGPGSEENEYSIIDADKIEYITNSHNKCDSACAKKILGVEPPK